jgi:hypothetical protein
MDQLQSIFGSLLVLLAPYWLYITVFWGYVGTSVISIYALWIFYLAIMNLKRVKDSKDESGKSQLGKLALTFGTPLLIVGYVLDMLVTLFIGTLVFLDLPKELTLTARLARYIKVDNDALAALAITNTTNHIAIEYTPTIRGKWALWFCVEFLDKFDSIGKHGRN